MILYYALGGGLGHITRAFAILTHFGAFRKKSHLLVSSKHAKLALPYSPCKIHKIDGKNFQTKRDYYDFLRDFLNRNQIKVIILDTFPFGILGEFTKLSLHIPKILVARSINFSAYLNKIKFKKGSPPNFSLIIEPLEENYFKWLRKYTIIDQIHAPIILSNSLQYPNKNYKPKSNCVVIHSGEESERKILIDIVKSRKLTNGLPPDLIHPSLGIYPAESIMKQYQWIVSGAGYNMAANAFLLKGNKHHILYPFKRTFDLQDQRIKRIYSNRWLKKKINGAKDAANLLLGKINKWTGDFR